MPSVRRPAASLAAAAAAAAGMTVLRVAVERWASEADGRPLAHVTRDAVAELRAVVGGT